MKKTTELELNIVREFTAPRELVWKAWTEPEQLMQWSCPRDFIVLFAHGELRPGGPWRSGMRAPDGREYFLGGEYREINAPERLVMTHAWDDEQGEPGPPTVVTIVLEEMQGGTRMFFHQTGFSSVSSREGHLEGWSETFDNLAAYLT